MFACKECLDSLKYLAKVSIFKDKSHCQKLDLCSQEFGFNNYHHFKNTLHKLPEDRFGKVSLKLMRKYCQAAKPSLNEDYVEFYASQGIQAVQVAFYSQWIGWDKLGREVREPRPYCGKRSIDGLRELFATPVYVVENDKQLISWLHDWYGTALIPEKLAKKYFSEKFDRRRLVCDEVNMGLVRACAEDHSNNVAT